MGTVKIQHLGNGAIHAKALNKRSKVAIAEIRADMPRRGRKPLKESEKTPISRFHRLAGLRVTRIIKLIGRLQNCANRDVYEFDERQVKAMLHAIYNAYTECKATFQVALTAPKSQRVYTVKKDRSFFDSMQ